MAKTSQQMAQNWQSAMASPQTSAKYKQGIANTTVNPMQLAASDAAEQLYLQRVQQSVANGKRRAKLNAVPIDRWKNNSATVGAASLSSGAQKASDKVMQHFNKWAPIYAQASAAAKALPKGGIGNAMARVQAAISVMMAAAGTA